MVTALDIDRKSILLTGSKNFHLYFTDIELNFKEVRFIWGKAIKYYKLFFQVLFSQYQNGWVYFCLR